MRLSFHRAPAEVHDWNDLIQIAPTPEQAQPQAVQADGQPQVLFVRHARKDGRLVAMLRAIDHGSSCVVEAEVSPQGTNQLLKAGPYTFSDAHQASAFVTEAVAALMYLGCDIQAA
jgi:hypothetical protein